MARASIVTAALVAVLLSGCGLARLHEEPRQGNTADAFRDSLQPNSSTEYRTGPATSDALLYLLTGMDP